MTHCSNEGLTVMVATELDNDASGVVWSPSSVTMVHPPCVEDDRKFKGQSVYPVRFPSSLYPWR